MLPDHKLLLGAVLVAGAIGYLAFEGAANSWQYYLSVDEAVNDAEQLVGKRVRLSGCVTTGTLSVATDRRHANFDLHGERHTMHVTCDCLLPDNMAENMEIVVEGTLNADCLAGRKVITRCASKYEPKQSPKIRN
jgi:cytochrome c-type biogenesis protein CcmE